MDKDHGYRRVVSFIRADNIRALYIRQKRGARYVSTKRNEIWADGSIGDAHTFIFDVHNPVRIVPQEHTVRHLTKTLQALNSSTTNEPRSEPGQPPIFTGAPISAAPNSA